ncbi:uncharacterized protein [Amphiura filiformis]|uniref:uncharacterized protein n=1 Tax=Amphiura filiformis TaxID=82378 RepID=UPI003B20BAD2
MKPVEVNEENFEALLAYDDLFLDYFNAFLSLPAFPQPLYYNRLTGTFQEVEDEQTVLGSIDDEVSVTLQRASYAPTDYERERIFDWAKKERLSLFLRTKLFLEYKLCKLLIRPLDERRSASRVSSSRNLRGYSRSTSYTNSTSFAASREASMYGNESDYWPENERAALFKYLRPGSRCISLPPMLGLGHYSPKWSGTNAHSVTQNGDQVNPVRTSNSATSRSSNAKGGTVNNGISSPNKEPDGGGGGDAGVHIVNMITKEPSTVNRTTSRGIKSALKSSASKANSPKKKATIKIPAEEDEDKMSPRKEHSSFTNASQITDISDAPHQNSFGSDDEDADDEDDDDDEDDLIDIDDSDEDEEDDDVDIDADDDSDSDDDDAAPSTIDLDEDDALNDERTETELRQVEGRHKMSFQQLKEELMGTLAGMEALKTFLKTTSGEDMLNFWLDCELYRDNVQALGETHANITRTRLFRDIQDKYRFKLTPDAMEQIKRAQGNTGLSESVFTRTQYDVLRRLRSYWVARFILHQERVQDYNLEKIKEQQMREFGNAKSPQLNFLPSISLVKSLPVRPSSCVRLATTTKDWNRVAAGGRRMQDTIQEGYLVDFQTANYMPRPLSARFHVGLSCDRTAGRPFQRYLEKHHDRRYLANLLFWQDVTDYGIAEDRDADRLLRMGQAWSIFSRFIVDGAVWNIGLPSNQRDFIHTSLLLTSDFVEASTFQQAKDHAVHVLQMEWLHYLKEDLAVFLECRARPEDKLPQRQLSPVKSPERPVEQQKRKSPIKMKSKPDDEDESDDDSEETESSDHDSSAEPEPTPPPPPPEEPKVMTKKMLEKQKRKEQKEKEAEEARKKAVKEKRKKQLALQRKICRQVRREREARNKPQKPKQDAQQQLQTLQQAQEQAGQETHGLGHLSIQDNRTEGHGDVTFRKMYKNKSVMSSFRNFVTEKEIKEGANILGMYLDIDMVLRIPDHQVERKFHQVKLLVSNYFDPAGKKAVTLHPDVLTRLGADGDRVSSKTIEVAQKSVLPELEKMFNQFWANVQKCAVVAGNVKNNHLDNLEEQGAKAELENMRAGSEASITIAYKKRRRGKVPNSGQQMPTGQDKNEFQTFLLNASRGLPPPKLMYFHRHLIEYGDKDNLPLLEKDLVFYLEAQRFKDAFYAHSEMELLKKKVEVITDCFLDSAVSHPPVQIDAPQEISSKVLKAANNFVQDKGKDPYSPNIFEETQYTVFKEMLPYWAAFTRRFDLEQAKKFSKEPKRLPSTRIQRLTKERLRMFIEMDEPPKDFKLPALNNAPQNRVGGTGITFSLSEGLQWKNQSVGEENGNNNYDYMDGIGVSEDGMATPKSMMSQELIP